MTRISLFNSPFLLGFDHFERTIDRISKNPTEGYPPYNIEQIGSSGLRITLAVAGFSKENLSVSVEDNQLTIRGKQIEDDQRIYLHRGIATRQFQRVFILAEGIEVEGSEYANGLLHVNLSRPHQERRIRIIDIRDEENLPRLPGSVTIEEGKKS